MNVFSQTITLIQKEFKIEFRHSYSLSGILLYVIACIFLVYMNSWTTDSRRRLDFFLWILIPFAAVNAVAKAKVRTTVNSCFSTV